MMTTSELGGLVAAFSVTHIGLSAVRERLIDQLGAAADSLGAVGRDITLPSFWIADTNGLDVWPDQETAGRQIYRAGYTAVSAGLLFPALAAYPEVRAAAEAAAPSFGLTPAHWSLCFLLAASAQAISLASLVNPSPLSLVPSFETDDASLLGVRRDDRIKLAPAGLTRVTRHPLILPVVPWGVANWLIAGRHAPDGAMFLGLALYALAGCYAQDLRVASSNQVGTVFEDGALSSFYRETSYIPFGAIVSGRQSLDDALREISWPALAVSFVVGAAIEWATLAWWVGVDMPRLLV